MKNRQVEGSGSESGFASIVIAIVMVIVLSLLTVGFAQLMRDEEKSALDKQLSSQAYYVAESGVNDAEKAINAGYRMAKTTCDPLPAADTTPGADFLKNNNAGSTTAAKYTCLTIDPSPPSVEYGSVDIGESKLVKITGVDASDNPQPIGYMDISWQDPSGSTNFAPGGMSFRPAASWTYTGVLRVGITPLISGCLTRDCLISGTYTAFLYPNGSAAGTVSDSYSVGAGDNQGRVVQGNCKTTNTPRLCKVRISNLSQVNYQLSLRSIYKNTRVSIQIFDSSGNPLEIANAQTVIDSTGKAQDVLKRIQVRVPTEYNYSHPDYGLETMGNICKQLQLMPTVFGSNTSDCTP